MITSTMETARRGRNGGGRGRCEKIETYRAAFKKEKKERTRIRARRRVDIVRWDYDDAKLLSH